MEWIWSAMAGGFLLGTNLGIFLMASLVAARREERDPRLSIAGTGTNLVSRQASLAAPLHVSRLECPGGSSGRGKSLYLGR